MFAGVVQTQSIPAYDVTGSADFLVAGQNFVANYSYTLEGPYGDPSVTNLSFTSSGQFGAFTLYAPNGVLWDESNGRTPEGRTTECCSTLRQSTFVRQHTDRRLPL